MKNYFFEKKWILSLCAVFLTFLALCFYAKDLFLVAVQWRASCWAHRHLGAQFSCESAVWSDQGIVFEGGRFEKPGKWLLNIPKTTWTLFFDWKKCSLGGEVKMNGPTVCISDTHPFLDCFSSPSKASLFLLPLAVNIEDGRVIFDQDHPLGHTSFLFHFQHLQQKKSLDGKLTIKNEQKEEISATEFTRDSQGIIHVMTRFEKGGLVSIYHLLTHCLPPSLLPIFSSSELLEGKAEGEVKASFKKSKMVYLGGSLKAEKLKIVNPALELSGEFEGVQANFSLASLEVSKKPTWEGVFFLEKGEIVYLSPHENPTRVVPLSLRESKIVIRDGEIQRSSIFAKLVGLEGEMNLNWQSPEKLVDMHFSGLSKEIYPFIPLKFRMAFLGAFPDDKVDFTASVKRSGKEASLEGQCTFTTPSNLDHVLSFGCHFGEDNQIKSKKLLIEYPEALTVENLLENLKTQFYFSSKRYGWIKAETLPIEKFISPFLFPSQLCASGIVDVEGTFDDRYLVVFYKGENFCVDGTHFTLKADQLSREISPHVVAVHSVDLKSFNHVGILPLDEATYYQKTNGLLFTHGKTNICFENEKIHFRELSCDWEGLQFEGEIDLIVHSLEDVDLRLLTNSVTGPAVKAQDFLSHYISSPFLKIPFDGTVKSGKRGVFFHFAFQPKAKLLEGEIQGDLQAELHSPLLNLENGQIQFHYSHQKNRLTFTEGCGILKKNLFSSSDHALTIPKWEFSQFPHPHMELTMKVHEGEQEVYSFEGISFSKENQRVFSLEGKGIHVVGIQEGERLHIDPFIWGDLKGVMDGQFHSQGFHLNRVRLKFGDLGSFSLEGWIDSHKKEFSCELSQLIVDLSALSQQAKQSGKQQWLSLWNPHGKLSGQGVLKGSLRTGEWELETQTNFHELECGGMHLGDGDHLLCRYSSTSGLTIQGLEGEIVGAETPLKYKLGSLHYDFSSQKMAFDAFEFSLPPDKLSWVSLCANLVFPGKINATYLQTIKALKREESLEGIAYLEVYPDHLSVNLSLKDGTYYFSNHPYSIRQFSLTYDSQDLFIQACFPYKENEYWAFLETSSPTLSFGTLAFKDMFSEEGQLTLWWEKEIDTVFLRRALGQITGLTVDLTEKKASQEMFSFEGTVAIDAQKASRLVSPSVKNWIDKFSLGSGYTCQGFFSFNRDNFSDVSFKGECLGRKFEMGHLSFDYLFSEVEANKEHVYIKDLIIQDPAAEIDIDLIHLENQDGLWSFMIPAVRCSNLRIRQLMPDKGLQKKGKSYFKSLIIPRMQISALRGVIGQKDSFRGHGEVQFANLPPKNLVSNLLQIPTEITARIGLDLSLLVPVRGTICYEVRDEKIHLTKLENMYSDGKRSRFFLAEGHPAFLDFNGNLHFKIKMKQYNLLMKLAEFFTVTVKGTLLKPCYTLINQFDDFEEVEEL